MTPVETLLKAPDLRQLLDKLENIWQEEQSPDLNSGLMWMKGKRPSLFWVKSSIIHRFMAGIGWHRQTFLAFSFRMLERIVQEKLGLKK
jgi:hypothetical protein